MEDQILCGGMLITKKKAKNNAFYLEFSRKTQRICVFEGEWAYMKKSADAVHKGETFNLSNDKKLIPDTFHGRKVVWVALNNGYKFYMAADDYEEVMRNVECIDRIILPNNQQQLYYTWETKEDTAGPFMQECSRFFNNKSDCENDAVQMVISEFLITSHKLEVKSPAQLAYFIYTYLLERSIEDTARKYCVGCNVEEYVNDFRRHSSGCLAEWDNKLEQFLDEAKSSVAGQHVVDLFFRISAHHGLPAHPHMINIIYTILEYGNITVELLKTHEYEPLLQHVLRSFYEHTI